LPNVFRWFSRKKPQLKQAFAHLSAKTTHLSENTVEGFLGRKGRSIFGGNAVLMKALKNYSPLKTLFASLALLVLILFYSCQREVDDTATPPPTTRTSVADSMLIEKLVRLDFDTGDTSEIESFEYDSKKRISKWVSNTYYFGPVPDVSSQEFFYSGNDSLPSKIIYVYTDASSTYGDTAYLKYVNGIVSRDSTVSYNLTNRVYYGTSVKAYTLNGSNMFLEVWSTIPPNMTNFLPQWSGTFFQTYQNGNITTQDDTSLFYSVYGDRVHQEATYDDKPNPLYQLEERRPLLNKGTEQKNNYKTLKTWDDPARIESDYRFTYTYRADGFPLMAIEESIDFMGSISKDKCIYIYKH
jgi:hypothetical protein